MTETLYGLWYSGRDRVYGWYWANCIVWHTPHLRIAKAQCALANREAAALGSDEYTVCIFGEDGEPVSLEDRAREIRGQWRNH